jgi:hypothetical protein
MLRPILLTAVLTGIFCSGFAVFIDYATEMLMRNQVIGISFASGFLGSLFAQTVLGRWRERDKTSEGSE